MAKTIETKSEETELVINTFQACNELKISGLAKEYVEKRFNGQEKTLREWKESFKKVRLDF